MKAEMRSARLAGHEVLWRTWPREGGRPVLALHCALSHGGEWAGLAGARPDLAVHAPDLVGHGRMPLWTGGGDPHRQSTDLALALAAHLGQGAPVDVIGHSFGGTVALRLALEAPQLVRRLILVEPVIFAAARGSAAWPGFLARHDPVERLMAAGDAEGALASFLAEWGAGDEIAALAPPLHDYMRARIPLVLAINDTLVEDRAGLVTPGRLEALDRPVQLVEGAGSPAIMAAIMDSLSARLPRAARAVVAGAGHMLPVTHGPALAALVQQALA